MSILNFITAITISAILSACASPASQINLNDPHEISSLISVKHDEYKKFTEYEGPNISSFPFGVLLIRAWKKDEASDVDYFRYQLYVMDNYNGDWRFYDSANDSNGNSLETKVIAREVGSCDRYGCSHFESLGFNVTRDYLEKNQEIGVRFKVSGRAGEQVFFFPPAYVKAFLSVAK